MKRMIKKVLKLIISDNFIKKYRRYFSLYKNNNNNISNIEKIKCVFFSLYKVKSVDPLKFSKIFKYIKSDIIYSKYFSYLIDFNCFVEYSDNYNMNMTPDYNIILENSLNDLKKYYKDNTDGLKIIIELEKYLDLYIEKIKNSSCENKSQIISNLKNIRNKKSDGFIESLQRILFFNQIFWQMGYTLCGFGRLDLILDRYYSKDVKNKKLNRNETNDIIIDFYEILNYHYDNKSSSLNGDTGQIIILGGLDESGNNFENDLTYSFIDALKEYNRPDPKLLLRVNRNTKKGLLEKAVECMATGVGSPLLSNDDIIIPKLIKFGYDETDAWNYVTAACWEPSPCGNSIDYNNVYILNLLEPFNSVFEKDDLNLENILDMYFELLREYISKVLVELASYKYDDQPYLSFFIKNCREKGTFINNGDVKYKNLGLTTLGISNVVNSLINIKRIVKDKKIMTLKELNELRKNNFADEDMLNLIHYNNKFGYGSNTDEAIELTNQISNFISNEFRKYKTYYGGNFKYGLSAPSYIDHGKNILASFDGRKNFEPLNVHISSTQNTFLEIMDFASRIEYCDNGINGNVVDFIVSPSYIKNNITKFTGYLSAYLKKGIYQLQINVVDSKTLLAAKENPNLYKNLIVRVWGFSAYFNELPDEYKDLLIKRALESERLSS